MDLPKNRKTTSTLVATALEGADRAGKPVVAADVLSGGVVRMFFVEPNQVAAPEQAADDNPCDELLK